MICWEDGIMFSAEYRRKWGVINIKGEVIIPFKFDWISWPDKMGIFLPVKQESMDALI